MVGIAIILYVYTCSSDDVGVIYHYGYQLLIIGR